MEVSRDIHKVVVYCKSSAHLDVHSASDFLGNKGPGPQENVISRYLPRDRHLFNRRRLLCNCHILRLSRGLSFRIARTRNEPRNEERKRGEQNINIWRWGLSNELFQKFKTRELSIERGSKSPLCNATPVHAYLIRTL